MLKVNSLVVAVMALCLLVLAQMLGCSSEKGASTPLMVVSDLELPDGQVPADVNDGQNESTTEETAVVYTWDDSYGQQIITEVLKTQPVRSYLDDYATQGYRFAPGLSFDLEGYAVPDGGTTPVRVQFVTIALTYQPDTLLQAMYITYTRTEMGFIVAPYMLSFVEPEPNQGFSVVADGIWRLNYPAQVWYDRGSTRATLTLLDDYLDCVAERATTYCAAALIYCGVTGPGYPFCSAKFCAIGAIVAIVGCIFSTF